ncbi:MAG: DUF3857 domain-containing protein [Bacteroidales bacterium]|nr:DUF3857 domain-containing protein [Bacteroidales bacterium]
MLLIPIILPFLAYADKDPCDIISYETIVAVKGKSIITTFRIILQINSREGEEAAAFSFPFSRSDKITSLTGWVQDVNGKIIRRLEKNDIQERSRFTENSFYSDQKVKSFSLTYPEYPHQIIVECITKKTEALYLALWSPAYSPEAITKSAILTAIFPLQYPVNIFQNRMDPPVIDTLDENIRYCWRGKNLNPLRPEYWAPSPSSMLPEVRIVPVDFELEINGSFRNWAAFGSFLDSINHDRCILPMQDVAWINSLREKTHDTLEQIRAIYHYIQDQTRYLSVSILNSGIIPATATSVSQKKYGDCKGLAIYAKALLGYAGISAYYTLVFGDVHPEKILSDFPSQQFNHAILCIPFNKKDTLWMDCTNSFEPLGYTGTFIQGRPALVVNGNQSTLCNIPELNEILVQVTRSFSYFPKDNGNIRLTLNGKYRGPLFEDIIVAKRVQNLNENKDFAKKLIPFERFNLDRYDFTYNARDSFSAGFTATFELQENCRRMEDLIVLPIPALHFPQLEKVSQRRLPIQIDFPIHNIDTLVIPINLGFQPKLLPVFNRKSLAGMYRFESRVMENQLICIREFLLKRGTYPLADYAEVFDWISAIRAYERQTNIILTKNHD